MLDRLKSLFVRGRDSAAVVAVAMERPDVSLSWQEGATWPVPDWEAIAEQEQADWADARKDGFWSEVALQWLGRMATEWEHGYGVQASREFLLLSALPARDAKVFLEFCESARKRILRFLDGIASVQGSGKHVVIVFDDQDDYYDYVSNYYPDGGEYAMSSGMFINAGYGHFVLWAGELHAMEPVIAHELTHCLVSHLPLPAWLNEGIAVNSEHRIFPQLAHPNAQQYFPHEMVAKHASFWNAQTIQEFWSGKSFLRTDEGNMLSYDLAKKLTALAAQDFDAFRRFATRAQGADGGLAAAAEELGYPLAHLVGAVLGEGAWEPKPEAWEEGVERGQF